MSRRLDWALLVWLILMMLACGQYSHAAKFPKNAKINDKRWEIKRVDVVDPTDKMVTGTTDCPHHQILVDKNSDEWHQAEILVHEFEHAFTCDVVEKGLIHDEFWNNGEYQVGECGEDHCGIYFSAKVWFAFIRENPDVLKFLEQAEPPRCMPQMVRLPSQPGQPNQTPSLVQLCVQVQATASPR